jgi:3',5'-cyclic AMP phosphodiesterase CpdA
MPLLLPGSLSRRSFLAAAAAGAPLLSLATQSSQETHWALLSDTHIPLDTGNGHRGFKPYDNLKRVVPEVVAAKPEGALICGDLARLEGLPGDYQNLKTLLEPLTRQTPVECLLGNHDDRRNFLAAFGPQPGAQAIKDRHVSVIETAHVRLINLDSLVAPNSTPGFLGKAQRQWLSAYLASSSKTPTVVAVHHTLDDNDGALLDAPRLFEVLAPHSHVKAVLYGHSHQYSFQSWDRLWLINLPAVGYNFNDREPVGWVDARFSSDGAAFTLRAFGGNLTANGKTTRCLWR